MTTYWLKFVTKSDATFGRGDGLASLVDAEVQHDRYGLPFLGGRSLKGLLEEECANILFALAPLNKDHDFNKAAKHLFGNPGSTDSDKAILHISDAKLPEDLRNAIAIASEVGNNKLGREQVLNSLTAIRRQTAISESGAPKKGSLRAMRVILRETPFEAELSFNQEPSDMDLPLLAACVKAFRRAGTGRNRGRGELTAMLCNEEGEDETYKHFAIFEKKVIG
ncbi:MAG: hypothetical protein C4B59_12130 [Candidatus Methanogaster sp.]|uniref:Uncharacterized protein n=1 Tax=Candidatus Methanogaster sp. TaxID=3386292 RepID=A0AC61L0Z3_9EURY|nr:MAG: hypothetical protein C4B59_12130 [ANME-2 cluster archaeon]